MAHPLSSDGEQELPSKIRLDVGGALYTTHRDTLTLRDTESTLSAMFSGRHSVNVDPVTVNIAEPYSSTETVHIFDIY